MPWWKPAALFAVALAGAPVAASATGAAPGQRGVHHPPPADSAVAILFDRWKDPSESRAVARDFPLPLMDQLPERATANPRKVDFISALLPLVIDANVDIVKQRRRIQMLALYKEAGNPLAPGDRRWLERMAARYRTEPGNFAALLRRVDIVPPSLVLAQAAEESGWGRSRFARFGNALFGQRVWNGSGMIPLARPDGKSFAVRAFASLVEAVRSYLHNLNTHFAYAEFRHMRAAMRLSEVRLDAYRLTGALGNYSERRGAYLDSIRAIISFNGLEVFDQILAEPGSARPGA